jgi:hypothetical protein
MAPPGCRFFGDDIDIGPSVVLTALSVRKLIKLILKLNFRLITRPLGRLKASN